MLHEFPIVKPFIEYVCVIMYVGLVFYHPKRAYIVWGAITLLFTGFVFHQGFGLHKNILLVGASLLWTFFTSIDWNVLGMFFGMLLISDLFVVSKAPARMAGWLIRRSKTAGVALLWVCGLAGLMSAFTDTVATVLVTAPIALSLSWRLRISSAPFLIGIALASNVQEAATLIGGPAGMMTASFLSRRWGDQMTFGFDEFFVFQGKPGIFWAVQFGAAAAFLVLYLLFRHYRETIGTPEPATMTSPVPSYILIGTVVALAIAPRFFAPHSPGVSGIVCLLGALAAVIWQFIHESHTTVGKWDFKKGRQANAALLKRFDWETTIFLSGIFVMAALVEQAGVPADIAAGLHRLLGQHIGLTFLLIVWMSVLVSAVIDHIPYLMVMLPVIAELGERLGGPASSQCYLLSFGLLIGACFGSNCTPGGAASNMAVLRLLKDHGSNVGAGEFARIGIPFTIVATAAGSLFVWLVWT